MTIDLDQLASIVAGRGRDPCVERAEIIANQQLAEWAKQNPNATAEQIRAQARQFMEPLLASCSRR